MESQRIRHDLVTETTTASIIVKIVFKFGIPNFLFFLSFKLSFIWGKMRTAAGGDCTSDSSEELFKKAVLLLLLSRFRRVLLFATPWTVAHQAPLSMGFSRQEYWSGLPSTFAFYMTFVYYASKYFISFRDTSADLSRIYYCQKYFESFLEILWCIFFTRIAS